MSASKIAKAMSSAANKLESHVTFQRIYSFWSGFTCRWRRALLRGAVGLSTLFCLTPAVIGLTVVAAGTSVPELAVSAIAAYQGKLDIAVANVVGSNIFNITVIVGLCAIIRP